MSETFQLIVTTAEIVSKKNRQICNHKGNFNAWANLTVLKNDQIYFVRFFHSFVTEIPII